MAYTHEYIDRKLAYLNDQLRLAEDRKATALEYHRGKYLDLDTKIISTRDPYIKEIYREEQRQIYAESHAEGKHHEDELASLRKEISAWHNELENADSTSDFATDEDTSSDTSEDTNFDILEGFNKLEKKSIVEDLTRVSGQMNSPTRMLIQRIVDALKDI